MWQEPLRGLLPHVFLSIPNVALSSKICGAEVGMNDLRDHCLEDLEKAAHRGKPATASQATQPTRTPRHASEILGKGKQGGNRN